MSTEDFLKLHWMVALFESGKHPLRCFGDGDGGDDGGGGGDGGEGGGGDGEGGDGEGGGGGGGDEGEEGGTGFDGFESQEEMENAVAELGVDPSDIDLSDPGFGITGDLSAQEMADLGLGGAQGSFETTDPGTTLEVSGSPADVSTAVDAAYGLGPETAAPDVSVADVSATAAPDVSGLAPESSFGAFSGPTGQTGLETEAAAAAAMAALSGNVGRDDLAGALAGQTAATQGFTSFDPATSFAAANPDVTGVLGYDVNPASPAPQGLLDAPPGLTGTVTGKSEDQVGAPAPGTPGVPGAYSIGPGLTDINTGTQQAGTQTDPFALSEINVAGSPPGTTPGPSGAVEGMPTDAFGTFADPIGTPVDAFGTQATGYATPTGEKGDFLGVAPGYTPDFGHTGNPYTGTQVSTGVVLDPTQANRIDQQQMDRELNQIAFNPQLMGNTYNNVNFQGQVVDPPAQVATPAPTPAPPSPPPGPSPTQSQIAQASQLFAPAQLTPVDQALIDQERAAGTNREEPQGPLDVASDKGLGALLDFLGGQQAGGQDPGANATGSDDFSNPSRQHFSQDTFASADPLATAAAPVGSSLVAATQPAQPSTPPPLPQPLSSGQYAPPGFDVAPERGYPAQRVPRNLRDAIAAALLKQTQDRLST